MTRFLEILRAGFIGALFVGGIAWIMIRSLKKSEDPARLVFKWVLTGVVMGVLLAFGAGARDPGSRVIAVVFAAVCGIVLTFIWATSVIDAVARPFMDLYSGGSRELDPQPFYSIAEAKRKRGLYREAAAEIRTQLARFPGDVTGTLMLADIEAEHFGDLTAAQSTIERLVSQPGLAPVNISAALNRLADWHLRFGQDPGSARTALERIIDLLPDTEQSYLASQRIAHLTTPAMLAEKQEPHRLKIGEYEQRVGLVTTPLTVAPPTEDGAEAAGKLVRHLEEYPLDAEAREKLALIYADHYQRLDLAHEQLEQLIAQPNAPSKQVAHWLNAMADLHIKHAADAGGARAALQRIAELFPHSAAAETARNRIAHLQLELRAKKKSQVVKLGSYEQNIGLK